MATTTNPGYSSMLNEVVNPYKTLAAEKNVSDNYISERERIRNKFIDANGRNPTDEELAALQAKIG